MVRNLGKFELYNPFFSKLKGAGEPVRCDDGERGAWLVRLEQLKGTTPFEEFDTMVEFMIEWGHVREVLRYDGGVLMVRYEVGGMLYGGDDIKPVQLLARFADCTLEGYTVIRERGVAKPFEAKLCVDSDLDKSLEGRTQDRGRVLDFAGKMKPDDFVIVSQKDGDLNFAQVLTCCNEPDDVGFIVEWQSGSLMWQCATQTRSREDVRRFLAAYMDEGLPAAQTVFDEWHLVDWYGYEEKHGRKADIDRYLSAAGLEARRRGNTRLVRRLEKLGILLDYESVKANSFKVNVGKCPREKVLAKMRKDAEWLEDRERAKVRLYLSLHSRAT